MDRALVISLLIIITLIIIFTIALFLIPSESPTGSVAAFSNYTFT